MALSTPDSSSDNYAAVTPSDTVAIVDGNGTSATWTAPARYLYVGGTGNITCLNRKGTAVLFSNLPVGWHPIRTIRVNNTGTSATLIVAMF